MENNEMWDAPDIVPSITRVLDHEGHQWEISQRGRDLAADRWQLPSGVMRGASK